MASIKITTTATVSNSAVEGLIQTCAAQKEAERGGFFPALTVTKTGVLAAWEHGGALTSSGEATIWASEHARPLPLIYERTKGERACGAHALVGVSIGSLRIRATWPDKGVVVEELTGVSIKTDGHCSSVSASYREVWRGLPGEEPSAWLLPAVSAAKRKAAKYHCRAPYFVARKAGGLKPVLSRAQIAAAARATKEWPTTPEGKAAAERNRLAAEQREAEERREREAWAERERARRAEEEAERIAEEKRNSALLKEREEAYGHAVGDIVVATLVALKRYRWGTLRLPWGEEVDLPRSEAPDHRFDAAPINEGDGVPLVLQGFTTEGPIWSRRGVSPEEREEALKGWVPPAPEREVQAEDLPGEVIEIDAVYKTASVRWRPADGVLRVRDMKIPDLLNGDQIRIKIRVWEDDWGLQSEFVSLV